MKTILFLIISLWVVTSYSQDRQVGSCSVLLGDEFDSQALILDSTFYHKKLFKQLKHLAKKKSSRKNLLGMAIASKWEMEMNTHQEIFANRINLSKMTAYYSAEIIYQDITYYFVELSFPLNKKFPIEMRPVKPIAMWVNEKYVRKEPTDNADANNEILPYLLPGQTYIPPIVNDKHTTKDFYVSHKADELSTTEEKISFLLYDFYHNFERSIDTSSEEADDYSSFYYSLITINENEYAYVEIGEGVLVYSTVLYTTESKDSGIYLFNEWRSFLNRIEYPYPILSYEPWAEIDSTLIMGTWYRTIGNLGEEDLDNGLYIELYFREAFETREDGTPYYEVIFAIKKPD